MTSKAIKTNVNIQISVIRTEISNLCPYKIDLLPPVGVVGVNPRSAVIVVSWDSVLGGRLLVLSADGLGVVMLCDPASVDALVMVLFDRESVDRLTVVSNDPLADRSLVCDVDWLLVTSLADVTFSDVLVAVSYGLSYVV